MSDPLGLQKKSPDLAGIAKRSLGDDEVLEALLSGISPETKKTAIRENSFRALMLLAERHPNVLFPHWDYFVGLLKSENSFSKYAAIYIITALVPADQKGLFGKAFSTYYGLLSDESVMVASHVAGRSGKIAKAKPNLQAKVTRRLLDIDKTCYRPERRDLVKAYAIEAFGEYFEESRQKKRILAFVRQQVGSESPKTRKLAKAFLKRWEDAI